MSLSASRTHLLSLAHSPTLSAKSHGGTFNPSPPPALLLPSSDFFLVVSLGTSTIWENFSILKTFTIIKYVKFPLFCKGHTQRGQRLRGLQELLFCLLQQLYPAWPWQWWGASPFLCKSVIDNAGEIALRGSLTIWTVTSHCLGRTLVLTWSTHSSPQYGVEMVLTVPRPNLPFCNTVKTAQLRWLSLCVSMCLVYTLSFNGDLELLHWSYQSCLEEIVFKKPSLWRDR